MASFNRVILMGRLTRAPEVRYIPSGTAVGDLSLAVSESFRNKAGETVETTCFVDVVVWSKQAELCAQYLSKGSPILVEGRLQQDKWKTKEGENRSKLLVRADRVQFLGGRSGAGAPQGGDRPEGAPEESFGGGEAPDTPAGDGAGEGAKDDDNLPF